MAFQASRRGRACVTSKPNSGLGRRAFVTGLTMAALSSRLRSANAKPLLPIGLQLYTVRSLLARDFEGTLAKVARIGYREVEFAGLFGRSPRAVKSLLDRHTLTAPSAHVDYGLLERNWPKALDEASALGQRFIVCGWIPEELRRRLDDWKRAADLFNHAGAVAAKAGLQFAYHNHDFEFRAIEGERPYDVLLASTDPQLVRLELDLYWIAKGGADPIAYFERHPGRFPLVHVKDMAKDGGITEVGRGTIDFGRILRVDAAGIAHAFVEQDNPASPFESIRTSFRNLARILHEAR
jgi:sugar phosphate isomerase/epimerase